MMKKHSALRQRLARTFSASIAAIVAGCTTTPLPPHPSPGEAGRPAPGPVATPAYPSAAPAHTPPAATREVPRVSAAQTPREYRRDGAGHLYALNAHRIFKGQMPPNLYAIGVLQVDLDRQGRVTALHWMRAPSHAPEVVAEIERTVRQASPFPAPARLGKVTYTDTWLWHKSGNFQLDTLTEGQL